METGSGEPRVRREVRVLVVDDSAVVRSWLGAALAADARIRVVGTASDGTEALRQIGALRPDVVTLDLEMPRVGGMAVLERLGDQSDPAFVVVSGLTRAGAEATLTALRKGAFECVAKPEPGSKVETESFGAALREKVLAAGQLRRRAAPRSLCAGLIPVVPLADDLLRERVVALGASCGGPQTLMALLPAFPRDFAPIVVTQHMPPLFTAALAEQLDRACAMEVREAREGDAVTRGRILIAPGTHHMRFAWRAGNVVVRLDERPVPSGLRPCIDVMFASAAEVYGARAIAVVLTGMGQDGARGIVRVREAGGRTIAQDQASSLVFGMPKAAIGTGAVEQVASLPTIPRVIGRAMQKSERTADAAGGGKLR